ncbi:carboxypeptidase regulatory-like domain-containing protein [Nocardioides sp. TF02-7]|uniref:carboxypeptidase regulatory-like domain-containing protein n=1 Tax=Nocardioides sp. TF02-7 TaxID=2917724 RepID=UPI001F052072|nr:carboxypeptidase regulatory-like domain-containing protein [Nocardioides sp. TF02-7]UMG91036.1 carboxypeptidase regulatory-like domain-containing protein [Nocardioides sp. TF02-7]
MRVPDEVPRTRTVTTTADGTWSIPDVTAPGYYLVTFSKPGYARQSYVVDSASADSGEPLEVELEPGDGSLSGMVRRANGRPVGAATVTISDGTSTLTTSSSSRGAVGSWSVAGLHTPGNYLVQVSSFGLGTESRLVELDAGGRAVADVRLHPGVATLSGKVEGSLPRGDFGGIGGVTVTATDEEGEQRTVTTITTRGLAGAYHLPDLPSPGTYTVTFTADGYQSQTSRLVLKPRQSRARLDAELSTSTGVVAGVVRETGDARPGGRRGTGAERRHQHLQDHLDRRERRERPARRRVHLRRGSPGVYQLTTEYFEFETDVLTVRVRAGRLSEVHPRIERLDDGVLPATSTIRGTAVDMYSGDPLECTEADPCLASTETQAGDVVTVPFSGDEEYILPATGEPGLEPGLYTVQVSAPGYESASVRVQVPLGATVVAPPAELTKLPVIAGTLRVASGSPEAGNRTCIWATPSATPNRPRGARRRSRPTPASGRASRAASSSRGRCASGSRTSTPSSSRCRRQGPTRSRPAPRTGRSHRSWGSRSTSRPAPRPCRTSSSCGSGRCTSCPRRSTRRGGRSPTTAPTSRSHLCRAARSVTRSPARCAGTRSTSSG